MRDPTKSVYDTLSAVLGDLYYSGTKYPVQKNLANSKSFNYVWLRSLSWVEDGAKGKTIYICTMDMEISSEGITQQGHYDGVNAISDLINKILDKDLTFSGYSLVIPFRPLEVKNEEERIDEKIVIRKTLRYEFQIQQQ
jgi:hypothetical protein